MIQVPLQRDPVKAKRRRPEYALDARLGLVWCPFTILVDQQEGLPYTFPGVFTTVKKKRVPMAVTTEICHLATGDYTIKGFADQIGIERKTHEDYYQTLTWGRERFKREMDRLLIMDRAWVIVEATAEQCFTSAPSMSRASPYAVTCTWLSWQERWPKVQWLFLGNRAFAERVTFRLLEMWWRTKQKKEDLTSQPKQGVDHE